jgi:hypothetical protein
MLDKFAGYKTEIRILEKKLKELDHTKLNPTKVKELTEAIKNLKEIVKEKEDKREDRKKKKEEAAKAAPVEATVQPTEVVKESLTTPTEVTKESDTTHFAIDAKVEPTRGTPGSWGTVIRSSGTNGDPLVYVKWADGPLKSREEYGAYYESDLKMKVEKEAVSTDYVPREQVYNLEADLKSNYERSIADLQEEIQTAKDKAEYAWVGRLEAKLADIKKTYDEKYNKTAEGENGSGGTNKLKVVDQNPAYDKDPQEKSTGYGGDRPMGAMIAPNTDENSLPLESAKKCYLADCKGTIHKKEDGTEVCDTCHGEWGRNAHKEASLKFADLDLNSLEKRWALYVDGKLAIRTLTRSKAERIAKERFPEQVAAGKYEIKREDHVPIEASKKEAAEFNSHGNNVGLNDLYVLPASPEEGQKIEEYLKQNGRSYEWSFSNVEGQPWHGKRFIEIPFGESLKGEIEGLVGGKIEAALVKRAINITVGEKLFVVNPLAKTADNEYAYDVTLGANNQKLFKITSKDEMGQEHLTYVIGKELMNKKEASKNFSQCSKCKGAGTEKGDAVYPAVCSMCKGKGLVPNKKSSLAKLTSNLAFLKKGSLVSILAVDNSKKQVKFASLDNSLRGWAPIHKFAAMNVPEAKLVDHEGHKDEVLAESGHELLVTCPANSVNVEWRTIEAPPATPESLNPDVTSAKKAPHTEECNQANDRHVGPTEVCICNEKKAAGCDQCEAAMINGVFCHETGCPNRKRKFEHEDLFPEALESDVESSLTVESHIRHEDGKWVIYSHDYKKKLGTYDSKEAAEKRLKQIEYFKHQGSMQPLSKKEAEMNLSKKCQCSHTRRMHGDYLTDYRGSCQGKNCKCEGYKQQYSKKEAADVMETKCEECGEPLGPEVFLSKHPVCGKCTKKRHEKSVGKRASDEISLEQQVQGFRQRMSAVTERLANPPAKTADLETTQDLSNVDVKDLSSAILHTIDLLESKVGENVSADPELHPMLEDLENKVYEIEMKMGIKPNLPEHERLEPEHKEVVKEVEEKTEKEASWPSCSVEGCNNKADSVAEGKRYCYTHSWGKDPKNLKEASEIYCKNSDCECKATVRRPDGNWCAKHAPETKKEAAVEVKADDVNVPPTTLPPQGFRYAWDPKNRTWILVQQSDAPGGGY